jgi:hypothetical protein
MSQPDILTISSYNSLESQTASYFEALLPSTIINPKRMILNKFIMPNLMYDISSNYNKIGMQATVTTPAPATYNINISLSTSTHWASGGDFATYLTNQINLGFNAVGLAGNPFTISYSVSSAKLTITPTAGITNYGIVPWDVPDPVTSASSWYKLGFTKSTGTLGYVGNNITGALTGDSPLILLSTTIIYVSISLLGNSLNDKRDVNGIVVGDDTIYGAIPVSADFGQMIIYADSFGSYVSCNVNSIRSIRVQLLNEEYNQIQIPRNCYATMEFRMEYT